MSRFLVTGATGFIGSAVVRRLAKDGHDVVAVAGRRGAPFGHPRVDWVEVDLLADAPRPVAATHCIHAAWYTNHADYLVNAANRAWASASLRLAEAFAASGGQRFIGLGTCFEYDLRRANSACSEEATPLRPESLYGRCKLELFEELQRSGLNFAWPRIFFVYGPGDRAGRLIPNLIERLERGEPAGPTSGGLRRDYIHVDDLAGQLIRIALSGVRDAINTGTGAAPTLSQIAAAAADALNRHDLARPNDAMGSDPPVIQADLTRFRKQVGEPEARTIAAGLRDLVA